MLGNLTSKKSWVFFRRCLSSVSSRKFCFRVCWFRFTSCSSPSSFSRTVWCGGVQRWLVPHTSEDPPSSPEWDRPQRDVQRYTPHLPRLRVTYLQVYHLSRQRGLWGLLWCWDYNLIILHFTLQETCKLIKDEGWAKWGDFYWAKYTVVYLKPNEMLIFKSSKYIQAHQDKRCPKSYNSYSF